MATVDIREVRKAFGAVEVLKGVDEIRAGHYTTLESPEDFDDFAEQVITGFDLFGDQSFQFRR